jgi:hypothetical protein
MNKEVAVGTVIQSQAQSNDDRTRRWSRTQRAARFEQYLELHAQGLSLRQAAKVMEVPRSTLQAWRAYQDSLDAHPAVVAFFHSSPGLAFLHRVCCSNSPASIALWPPPMVSNTRSTAR